jgi:hypothetical protein
MKHVVIRPRGRGSNRDTFRSSATRRRLKATNLRKIILLFTLLAILGCSDNKQAGISTGRSLGANSSVGNGRVSSYAEFDQNGAPRTIGIVFQASALEGLPPHLPMGITALTGTRMARLTSRQSASLPTSGSSHCPVRRLGARRSHSNGWA